MVVGNSIHNRFSGANVGDTLDFAKGQWKVVGVFDSGGTAYDSEIWGDVNQIAADFDRQGAYASAYLRATDPIAADALKHRVSDDQRLKLEGTLETEYYEKQTSSGGAIKFIGTFVAIIMAIGSSFAAMNTMYAAVAYRSREIATLRIIGFSRPSILTSFVIEALAAFAAGSNRRHRPDLALQRHEHRNRQLANLQRNGFQSASDVGVAIAAVVFALDHGPAGRLRAGLARSAPGYSDLACEHCFSDDATAVQSPLGLQVTYSYN